MESKKKAPNTPPQIINEIMQRFHDGMCIRALAAEYGKPYKTIRNMITRENNKKRKLDAEQTLTKQRGRKPAVTLAEYKYENKRLKMENELLRDFHHLAGRR